MAAMFKWVDARGAVVAEIHQELRRLPGQPPTVMFVAKVLNGQTEKPRFACAKRVVDDWLRNNRISATPVST